MKHFRKTAYGDSFLGRLIHVAVLLCCVAAGSIALAQTPHPVLKVRLEDTIQPVSEQILERALDTAAQQKASAVLVELNTPGGILDSTRAMVHAIEVSPVPVLIYVSPQGAHAASAGFFLLEAGDVAAMAPGTNTGAAHPVLSDGSSGGDVMKQKMESDAAAFLRSYTGRRGRNADVAESAVLQSKSFTAEEALAQHLIEIIAVSDDDLLQQANGRTITRMDGSKVTLATWPAHIETMVPTVRESVLDRLMDPNAAVLLLLLGALLIYVEFHIPGTIVPGAVGGLFLLTAVFALHLLPIHLASVALLLAAAALLLLEAKFPSHGLLSAAGIVTLLFGLLTLVEGPVPQMRVRQSVAFAVTIAFGAITFFLARLALKARRQKSLTGAAALVGHTAEARTALNPAGQVFVHGELWQAISASPVARGAAVVVRGYSGLTLQVEPATSPYA